MIQNQFSPIRPILTLTTHVYGHHIIILYLKCQNAKSSQLAQQAVHDSSKLLTCHQLISLIFFRNFCHQKRPHRLPFSPITHAFRKNIDKDELALFYLLSQSFLLSHQVIQGGNSFILCLVTKSPLQTHLFYD